MEFLCPKDSSGCWRTRINAPSGDYLLFPLDALISYWARYYMSRCAIYVWFYWNLILCCSGDCYGAFEFVILDNEFVIHFIDTFDALIIATSCLLWTYFRFSEPNIAAPTGYYIWASYPWAGCSMCVCSTGIWFYVAFVTVMRIFGVYNKEKKMVDFECAGNSVQETEALSFQILEAQKGPMVSFLGYDTSFLGGKSSSTARRTVFLWKWSEFLAASYLII